VGFFGSWPTQVLAAQDPVQRTVAAVCAVVLAAATAALGVASWRSGLALIATFWECHSMPGEDELAVIDDARLEAFALPALPGLQGWVVVSTGMLRTLEAGEREALLAREGAYTVERWADEETAGAIGDQKLLARALARAALARKASREPGREGVLAATGGPVPRRIKALLAPPPVPRRAAGVVRAAAGAVLHESGRGGP
jgi:hypothetical protein